MGAYRPSARFAAHHPNVAILDLSSFKCGHDAPTYGIVDAIVNAAGTPYSALHDIDANKPTGSMKIRVKTYSHTLKLHQERLEDLSRKRAELAYRMDQKRVQLLELKQKQLSQRFGRLDPTLAAQIEAARGRMSAYEAKVRAAKQGAAKQPGMVGLGKLRLGKRAGAAA